MIHVIDLQFLGFEEAIACFLLESNDGLVLIETGPYSTFPAIEHALREHGQRIQDVQHVLLSHIHFDHAGAAWAFAKAGAKIYLHPFGVPHLQDPSRLYESARRIYGNQMERLWGEMQRIDQELLVAMPHEAVLNIGEHQFTALHTPGHAKHHLAWQWEDTLFTGDVAGVKIGDGPVVPPCPPPDIDLEDWNRSLDILLQRGASQLMLTHFGTVTEIDAHIRQLREILNDWAFFIKEKWESGLNAEALTPLFSAYTADQLRQKGVSERGIQQYEAANPSWMSVAGLIRYWSMKAK